MDRNPITELVQPDQFIGWTYHLSYEKADVLTKDDLKIKAKGVPMNSFFLAETLDKDAPELILMRVTGTTPLPAEDENQVLKIQRIRTQNASSENTQYAALACKILGTFYMQNGILKLGSDLESFTSSECLKTYRPTGKALEAIVNYCSPERAVAAEQEARRLGLSTNLPKFQLGTIRYTSTDKTHRSQPEDQAAFNLNSIDFLARRTAVLGMTRTGKSNTIKQLASVVMQTSRKCHLKIGQIIYDLNGEYANANQQDKGSLADVFPYETIRYRMIPTRGFQPMLNNFFTQIKEGHAMLAGLIEANTTHRNANLDAFINIDFTEPNKDDYDPAEYTKQVGIYKRKIAVYQAILFRAGYEAPLNLKITFEANSGIRNKVNPSIDPNMGMTPTQTIEWFELARRIQEELITVTGKDWIDPDTNTLMNILLQQNDKGAYTPGFRLLQPYKEYHAPTRTTDVYDEIYQNLVDGKIVILDLSVGDPNQRKRLSKRIAQHILKNSMATFNQGKDAPHIIIYIEEAHNLMGRNDPLTDIWPTIAKEGAKARIGTVYATQEVSSIHPNILANTENIIVSHINNENEIMELGKYYDFRDFSNSLIRAQNVGFARVKTLSNPFVIPVQIDKFDPAKIKNARDNQTSA